MNKLSSIDSGRSKTYFLVQANIDQLEVEKQSTHWSISTIPLSALSMFLKDYVTLRPCATKALPKEKILIITELWIHDH